jgi:hypothetical protein
MPAWNLLRSTVCAPLEHSVTRRAALQQFLAKRLQACRRSVRWHGYCVIGSEFAEFAEFG